MGQIRFSRGLNHRFLSALRDGTFTHLLQVAKSRSLDVQIRENCLDLYGRGRCVLSLTHVPAHGVYHARIHRKFVTSLSFEMLKARTSGNYTHMTADGAFVDWFILHIDRIVANACATAKKEATIEECMIQASLQPGASVVFIDRQMQLHGVRLRMDLLGLTMDGDGSKVLLTEVKQGHDNRIQDLAEQTGDYCSLIAPDGYLRSDVLESYRKVLDQKRQLSIISPDVQIGDGRIPVECLLVLYDYNDRSQLLGRLRERAKTCSLPTHLVRLERGVFRIPAEDCWERLS